MNPNPQPKTSLTDALTTLRSNFQTSTSALRHLETYIHHLETLLLEQLGREEFERRLEDLILGDQRDEESLFIPDDTPNPSARKRRDSESVEIGSESKKQRLDSAVSGFGRSILEDGRRLYGDEPDLSPTSSSRKTSGLALAGMDARQTATTKTVVKQTARRPIIAPRSRPPRGSHSAMLPNKQPSSNFHGEIQSGSLPNRPSSDYHSESSSPLERRSSISTAHSATRQSSPASLRRESVRSETASKQPRSCSISSSSICNNSSLLQPNSLQSASRPATTRALPEKPIVPSAQASTCSTRNPSYPSRAKTSSSSST